MIAFSIVLMSRSRPEMLHDLYLSFIGKSRLNNHILVGLDSDDPRLDDYKAIFSTISLVDFDIQPRRFNLHSRINDMMDKIRGKYVFVLNDDCKIITDGWDEYAIGKLNEFGDIVYGRTYDNSIDRIRNDYAAFPIVSKIAIDKLGFIMDETYANHGCDVMMHRIFNAANAIVDLPNVKIDHTLHNSEESLQRRQSDTTATDMIKRTFLEDFSLDKLMNRDISDKVRRLL